MLRKICCRAIVPLGMFVAATAWSASNSKSEDSHLLAVGAGVSAPSVYNALSDNPAVIPLISGVRLQARELAPSASITPLTSGVHVLLGNGTIGGQVGLELAVPGALAPSIRGAIGASIQAIKTAIGLTCQLGLNGAVSVTCGNLGLLFNSDGLFRVGLTLGLSGLWGGGFPIAAGAALDLFKMFTLALDLGTSVGGGAAGFNLMPALGFRIAMIQLTAGYGLSLFSGGSSGVVGVGTGFTAGLGVLLGKSFHLMAHYNHTSWGMLSAVYRF